MCSRQLPHGSLSPASRASRRKCFRVSSSQRDRTVWRLDGGSGSEQKLRWLVEPWLSHPGKGHESQPHHGFGSARYSRWDAYGDAWVAEVPAPQDYARPVRVFVKRRPKDGEFQYSYYVTTLSLAFKRELPGLL